MVDIRPAVSDDIPAITEIYNEAVLTTDATFDTVPRTLEQQTVWFNGHNDRNPVIVALENGTVAGWASLSKWSDRAAYADTAEISVYVGSPYRYKGIGKKLMEAVILRGESVGLHTILSRITRGNDRSVRLHESLGFETIGVMREVGKKHGKLLDVLMMQKIYPPRPE